MNVVQPVPSLHPSYQSWCGLVFIPFFFFFAIRLNDFYLVFKITDLCFCVLSKLLLIPSSIFFISVNRILHF